MSDKKESPNLEPIVETEDGEGGDDDTPRGPPEVEKVEDAPNPFEIQLSEIKEDRNIINIHQFYPSLEHQFSKSNTKFAEEQSVKTEEAIKELVEESSTFHMSEKGDGIYYFISSEL